ncbi:MAG: Lrp/AsnC family transcriptional regulator [Clostridiales bacterium]|mgnify:CR=1 FL=1|nr:Lrp/AsnC family transcriptional regulator [Clostridiales bacterium]
MTYLKNEILEILLEDSRTTPAQMAVMLGVSEKEIESAVSELEKDRVIVKYNTMIDRDKTDESLVEALIEVRVTPQRDRGFDEIARRIYRFPEVRSVYLMSGGYDLMVLTEGKTLKQVAFFVAEKLSTIEGVISTATHFVLKKYKDDGVVFDEESDNRLAVTP